MNQKGKNRDVIIDIYKSFETGDIERCKELVSPKCKSYIGGNVLDLEAWMGMGRMFMSAFPDGRHVWELAEDAGEYVLLNGYFTGTHTGDFQGIPPTGKVVKFSATIIDKVVDGKMVEHRGDFDGASLIQQLTH
jgi:predicted ester cyclase